MVLCSHSTTNTPIFVLCVTALLLYMADLAQFRDAYFYLLWAAVPLLTAPIGWFWLLEADDDEADSDSGWIVLRIIFQMGMTAILWIAVASLACLQLDWIVASRAQPTQAQQKTRIATALARQLEAGLHTCVPLVVGSIASQYLVTFWLAPNFGPDVAGTVGPYLFTSFLLASMLTVGSCRTSFPRQPLPPIKEHDSQHDSNSGGSDSNSLSFCLSSRLAQGHIWVLLVVPPAMHLATFMGRILSTHADMDDYCDWFLSFSVPYLLTQVLGLLHQSKAWVSPYGSLRLVGGSATGTYTSTVTSLGVAVLASMALQQRYLIPVAHAFSYHFLGVHPPTWLLTFYWTVATIALLFTCWLWGRKSTKHPGQPLLGEYQEDVLQLGLAVMGAALGKGLGMSWNFTPLPILAFLGLSLWLTTRMLRYLAIFLFVVHAAAFVAFTYRFAGMENVLTLPLPQFVLSLTNFGMLVVAVSAIIGIVAGLAVRSSGGLGAAALKRIDAAGILLALYTLCLMELEITLMQHDPSNQELSGVQAKDDSITGEVYSPIWGLVTSAILGGLSFYMKRVRMIKELTAWLTISLAIGKALAAWGDLVMKQNGLADMGPGETFGYALCASLSCMLLLAPHAIISPVHIKTSRYKRGLVGGSELSGRSRMVMFGYAFFVLPISVLMALVCVIEPILDGVLGSDIELGMGTTLSLLLGIIFSLWGLAFLTMLNNYLPDGGGEFWKRIAALAFLVGVILCLTSPSLGGVANTSSSASAWNPYRHIASVGGSGITATNMLVPSRSWTGALGLLSACLATLLALIGPLELKERQGKTGEKDRFLLLRTMIFSIMFGGGVAWFVIVQIMSEADVVHLIFATIACMMLSFLGTITAVLGYFLELDDFEEVEQIAKTFLLAMPIFLMVAGIPLFMSHVATTSMNWLVTYSVTCGLAAGSVAIALTLRKSKDIRTRGMANFFAGLSWLSCIAVLFGLFGVAGIDGNMQVTTVAGMAIPVVGTLALSPILLLLEGEDSLKNAPRRISSSQQSSTFTLSLPLPQLKKTNRVIPLFVGTGLIFLCGSLYAIAIRGSGFFSFVDNITSRSPPAIFQGAFASSRQADENSSLSALARLTVRQTKAMLITEKLAGASFWTSTSALTPLVHLIGLAATLPSFVLALTQWWWRGPVPSFAFVFLATVLNIFPILFCPGMPPLQGMSWMCLSVGVLQILSLRSMDRRTGMQL